MLEAIVEMTTDWPACRGGVKAMSHEEKNRIKAAIDSLEQATTWLTNLIDTRAPTPNTSKIAHCVQHALEAAEEAIRLLQQKGTTQ